MTATLPCRLLALVLLGVLLAAQFVVPSHLANAHQGQAHARRQLVDGDLSGADVLDSGGDRRAKLEVGGPFASRSWSSVRINDSQHDERFR